MRRLVGLTRKQLDLRERVLEGLVAKALRQTVRTLASQPLASQPLTAASEPPTISTTAAVASSETVTATLPPLELATVPTTWQTYVAAELYPFLVETYLAAGQATAEAVQEALGVALPRLFEGAAEAYLAGARNRLTGIGDELWSQLRDQLAEGYSAGESTHQLAARIRQTAALTEPRALVIARTEVIPAANAASLEQVQLAFTDEECSKEWLSTDDLRTREAHRRADGQRVPIHQSFSVGGEALPYPGWPGGSPENVISCRCSLAFVFADDVGENDDDFDALVADAAFEKKHHRDSEGKFAETADASAVTELPANIARADARRRDLKSAYVGGHSVVRQFTEGKASDDVALVQLSNGQRAVRKRNRDLSFASASALARREYLAGLVANALGIDDVVTEKLDDETTLTTFVDGETGVRWNESSSFSLDKLRSAPGAREIGLLDWLTNNVDRNGGNWIRRTDGSIRPIDHGHAFQPVRTDSEGKTLSAGVGPFAQYWTGVSFGYSNTDKDPVTGGFLGIGVVKSLSPRFTATELADARVKIEALKSRFTAEGDLEAYELVLRRLGELEDAVS